MRHSWSWNSTTHQTTILWLVVWPDKQADIREGGDGVGWGWVEDWRWGGGGWVVVVVDWFGMVRESGLGWF